MAQPDLGSVVTFGEIMLRLSPLGGATLREADGFHAYYGGAEANVAVALAQWGLKSRYLTALPRNGLGEGALLRLRELGVDTGAILRRGERLGVYFLESGPSKAASTLIYDRKGSAISQVGPGEVEWDAILEGASWFHTTGITPALSPALAGAALEGLRAAKARGLTVSLDLNYRSSLWSLDEARSALTPMMEFVDVLLGNVGQLAAVFGLLDEAGESGMAFSEEVCGRIGGLLAKRFGLELVAVTARVDEGGDGSGWRAFLHDGTRVFSSPPRTFEAVDGVGGGDAFAAGLIFGTLTGLSRPAAVELGGAAACLKQTMPGDFLRATLAQVREMVE
jgi:2-dehydro-3-deoxygluconokinase